MRYAGWFCTKGRNVYEPVENLPSRAFSGNTYWVQKLHSAGRSEMRILTGHWDMRSSDLSSTDLMRNLVRFA